MMAVSLSVYLSTGNSCKKEFKYYGSGCFKARHDMFGKDLLPKLLFTDRDVTSKVYSNIRIKWSDWNNYLQDIACRCAESAEKSGYDYFGVQFYGEFSEMMMKCIS